MRRLSRTEYVLTVQHLLALPAPPDVQAIPAEAAHEGFTVHADLQTLSAQHLRAYLQVATDLADDLLTDDRRRDEVIGCDLASPSCLDDFVSRFGRLAFRRPLTTAEHTELVSAAVSNAFDQADRFRYAIEAMLVSPNFLYRTELGDGVMTATGASQLSAYELASRLSFAMSGHGPSAELLDRAERGELDTADGLLTVARSLAQDAGFESFYANFFEQWLGYDKLITPKLPPADWDDGLLDDMRAETRAVLDRFAWQGAPFLDVLTTNQTVLTPRLAEFYGLPSPAADGTVEVPAGHPRAQSGLLTHASVLSQKTDGDRIAVRGNWVRRTFLCRGLHLPEAIAASLGERLVGLTPTEIVVERNTNSACRGCHGAIDPIGIGLDRFDATGRFDPDYELPDYGVVLGLPDAPEETFDNVAGLSEQLKALPQVAQCLAERTFLFANGREPRAEDKCTVASARDAFVASGYDFRVLVESLLTAPSFALRRAPEKVLEEGVSP